MANGIVYFGSIDNNVYALDASTGSKLWSYTTGEGVASSPAVADGVVYIGSNDYNVYAFGLGNRDRSTRPDPKKLRPDLSLKLSN